MKRSVIFLLAAALFFAAPTVSDAATELERQISFAEHYLKEFEAEVARQKGGQKSHFRYKESALQRVQALVITYPDDPTVQEMYRRTRLALKKSYGNFREITADDLLYKRNEAMMRKKFSDLSSSAWKEMLAGKNAIEKAFPAPDPESCVPSEYFDRYIVLENVKWPQGQFMGATGEYMAVGKPSTGHYFVSLSGRAWVGAYEAIKRFRRQVDTSIGDELSLTVFGKITGLVMESTDPAVEKKTPFVWGWVVTPEVLYLPDRVIAYADASHDKGGYFKGEELVQGIKESWYTVKSVPQDADPREVMEIFCTAIKEKNFDLYVECIRPEWRNLAERGDVMYHWDLHQRRFQELYVAVEFDKPKITVEKGFDTGDDLANFFLDDKERDHLTALAGEKLEKATVYSRAYDENGRQLNPSPHFLIRKGGDKGRWYVDSYAPRF